MYCTLHLFMVSSLKYWEALRQPYWYFKTSVLSWFWTDAIDILVQTNYYDLLNGYWSFWTINCCEKTTNNIFTVQQPSCTAKNLIYVLIAISGVLFVCTPVCVIGCPMLLLTGTASQKVERQVVEALHLKDVVKVYRMPDR